MISPSAASVTSTTPVSTTSATIGSAPPSNAGLPLPRLLLLRTLRLRWHRLGLPL
jgi:hypothetical protein